MLNDREKPWAGEFPIDDEPLDDQATEILLRNMRAGRGEEKVEFVGFKPKDVNPDRFRCSKCDCVRIHDALVGSPPRWMCAECGEIITPDGAK